MKIRRSMFSRLRRANGGQAIVEFAIILPAFLLMVLGMIDLARAWNAKQVLTDAAREAVRYGVVYDQTGLTYAVLEGIAGTAISNAGFDPALAQYTWGGDIDGPRGTQLQMGISYPYTFNFMSIFMDMFGAGTIQLQTRIIMRNE